MASNQIYREIIADYDRIRFKSLDLREARKKELRDNIAGLSAIDDAIFKTNTAISKSILNLEGSAAIDSLKEEMGQLLKNRAQLIKAAGYDEDYIENVYTCPLCRDTGFIGSKKCTCFNQKLIHKYYEQSNIKNITEAENFDTFDFRYYNKEVDPKEGISPNDKIKAIFQTCIEFVKSFDTNVTNLLFYGKPGLGKTFLCNCIAKDLLDRGKAVLYVTSNQLFKVIEDARFNKEELVDPHEQIQLFYTVDLLIIDDLGTEFSTIVTQSELFNLLNQRILEKKHTIISTNLSPRDYEAKYSDRVISRIMGNYKSCKFIGEDIRVLKKYAFLSDDNKNTMT